MDASLSQRWRCEACDGVVAADPATWRCACGGLWSPEGALDARAAQEVPTPLTAIDLGALGAPWIKDEGSNETGSFKVRGARALVPALRARGAARLIEDSSGNAGLAIATMARDLGLTCELHVPASVPARKRARLEATGAHLILVDGPREESARSAKAAVAADPDALYASHVYNPWFMEGVGSFATEVVAQLGAGQGARWYLPCGNGTLVLGALWALAALERTGILDGVPEVVAVQAARCAPIACEWGTGRAPDGASTCADGIAIAEPARGAEVVRALREGGGRAVAVDEELIERAARLLSEAGLDAEPTGSVALAGWLADRQGSREPDRRDVIALSGGGGARSGAREDGSNQRSIP